MTAKNSLIETTRAMVRLLVEETAHLPRWSQPFAIFGIAICFTIAMMFLGPFVWLSRRGARQREAVREIRRHVERLWSEESPEAAVARLRSRARRGSICLRNVLYHRAVWRAECYRGRLRAQLALVWFRSGKEKLGRGDGSDGLLHR